MLADLRDKQPADLRVGLGRDMRLTAPEMARELRDGLVDEGATVLDAGMVGTEMLYFLVGSRELDGGAMITASHNPKAYTGVKLVREGALALSGDAGIGDVQADDRARASATRPGGGSRRGRRHLRGVPVSTRSRSSTRARSSRCGWSSTAATGWPGRWSGRCSTASAST